MDSDDLLLERLRYRAWHPALRFDTAHVSEEWMTRRYGERFRRGWGGVRVPADSRYAREFFAGVPHRPAYGPATERQVAEAEEIIGQRLPELLRRVYLEVANGGFGPDPQGFASITDGYRDPWWDEEPAVAMCLRGRESGLPDTWFPIAPGGCTMYWYVVLDQPGNPVHHFDWSGWDFRPGTPDLPPELVQPIEVGIVETTPTLAEWLWHWVEGGHIVNRGP
jgi:hypothetical protein